MCVHACFKGFEDAWDEYYGASGSIEFQKTTNIATSAENDEINYNNLHALYHNLTRTTIDDIEHDDQTNSSDNTT